MTLQIEITVVFFCAGEDRAKATGIANQSGRASFFNRFVVLFQSG